MSKQPLGEIQNRLKFLAENVSLQDKTARQNILIEMTSLVRQLSVIQLIDMIQTISMVPALRFLSASGVYSDARTVLIARMAALEKELK